MIGAIIALLMCIILALHIKKKRKNHRIKMILHGNEFELPSGGTGLKFRSNSFDDQPETFMTPEGNTQPGTTAGNFETGESSSFV